MTFQRNGLAALGLCAALAGCGGLERMSPLGIFRRDSADAKPLDDSNPLKPDEKDRVKTASGESVRSDGSSASDNGPVKHDPATLKLIEKELADYPRPRRAELLQSIRKVPSAMVPHVLKQWRLAQQIGGGPTIHPGVGHSTDPSTSADGPRELLGTNPWANQPATRSDERRDDPRAGRPSGVRLAGIDADGERRLLQDRVGPTDVGPRRFPSEAERTLPIRPNVDRGAHHERPDHAVARGPAGGPMSTVGQARPETSAQGETAKGQREMGSQFAPPRRDAAELPPEWATALDGVISRLEADVGTLKPGKSPEEQQQFIRQHVFLRLLYLMAGRGQQAVEAIPHIEAADQEFWQQTLFAMANYFDSRLIPNRHDRAGQTVASLRTAVQRLKGEAPLKLQNVAFCKRIQSYGNYEPVQPLQFRPGDRVLLYAEVENFASTMTSRGQYRTLLKSTIEIYSSTGALVEKIDIPATEDFCRNYRRDYFHAYDFQIPSRASLGPHVLKLKVEDQLARKLATYTVNFTVE